MTAYDSTLEVLKALRSTLIADTDLTRIINERVYARPPEKAPFPYITIGDRTSYTDFSSNTHNGQDIQIDVHCWDQPKPQTQETKLCREIMGHVRRVLHFADLSLLPPHHAIVCYAVNGVGPLTDPDGFTQHGIVSFRILTDIINP